MPTPLPGPDRVVRVQRIALTGYLAVSLIALAVPATRDLWMGAGFHPVVIVGLSGACGYAAWSMWRRFGLDGTSQSFLLTAAFAALALLFAPHALLGYGPDEAATYLLFDPIARLVFAIVLIAAMLSLPVPSLIRRRLGGLLLLSGLIALIVDGAAHGSWIGDLGGYDTSGPVRVIEGTTLSAQVAVIGVAFAKWRRSPRPFLVTVGAVAVVMATASVLYLAGPAWSLLWWLAHLGLLVVAVILTVGISQQVIHAIGHEELVLHYQPKIDLRTGAAAGVEALVRWNHPERGLVPPDEFIPLIELSDLSGPFTEWVLRTALAQRQRWREAGLPLPVAVNLSPRLLLDEHLADVVAAQLEASGTEPAALELELTERAFAGDDERVLATLQRLRELGVRLSIDDYGTGYSSLASLRRFPVHEVKIDKSFVANMTRVESDRIIVRSSINLSHDLGMTVVAEGVEDEQTRDALAELGADIGQGYLWSRALPGDELAAWMRELGGPDAPRREAAIDA